MPLDSSWKTPVVEPLERQRVRLLVVERQIQEIERLALAIGPRVHEALGDVRERERLQPQKVELHEADRLDVVLVVLSDDRLVALEARDAFGERALADDDAGRVHAGVPREALETPALLHELGDARVALDQLLQLGLDLERLVDRAHLALALGRDEARDALRFRRRIPMARATSLITLRAFRFWKVPIWPTHSAPYFSATY
jgi:hypothetical protein